jgi:hypothetical protein
MADNIKHLNELNLNIQGKNKLITSIYNNLKASQTEFQLWKCHLKNGNLLHFVQSESQLLIYGYSQRIEDLICKSEKRFCNFKNYELKFVMLAIYFQCRKGR